MNFNSNNKLLFEKIMRITLTQIAIMIILSGFAFAKSGNAQEVLNTHLNLEFHNLTLKQALNLIEKEANVKFAYSKESIQSHQLINLKVTDEKLSEVLEKVLTPQNIEYELISNRIVLKRKTKAFLQGIGAQGSTITGTVTSSTEGPLPGVSVALKGTTIGTVTDIDGKYSISVPDANGILVFSFVGYNTEEVPINNQTVLNVVMALNIEALQEVVVVGYGTQRKRDVTGSVVNVSVKDFNKGPITNSEQLIMGKVAGVQITPNGGAPGSGSRIRIRGGASLNASNDPLIVIDGLPIENTDISGSPHPLSLINPNDIESFNILKDASASAIYGSRASNGVVLVTTKKSKIGDKLGVTYNGQAGLAQIQKTLKVLSSDDFRNVVTEHGTPENQALLGNDNTDWQKQIFRSAYSQMHNLSVGGSYKFLPYRISLGYLYADGILKTSNFERTSATVNLNPSFLDNHLRVNLSWKGGLTNSRYADQGAIGAAVAFDPTKPVHADNQYGGYYEWLDASGNPNPLAPRNPLGLLEQNFNDGKVQRSLGTIQFDYKFHFLPALRANLTLGYDHANGKGGRFRPATLASVSSQGGSRTKYDETKDNKLLDFYLNYTKDLSVINSRLDLTAGYSYQDFISNKLAFPSLNEAGQVFEAAPKFDTKTQYTLISLFARLNYSIADRYVITATVRRDGSSRFVSDNRWSIFPSLALAWRVKEESFLKNSNVVSDLKIRGGYGITGQQDISSAGISDYPFLARYSVSDSTAMYQFGNQYYLLLRPEGYDRNLKWEQTQSYNIGLDFGLWDKVTGSIDYYYRKTKDLLAIIPVPAGTNLTNRLLTNVGNMKSQGLEVALNFDLIKTNDFNWSIGLNGTYNENKITKLSRVNEENNAGIEVGNIVGGTGNLIQVHSVGYTPFSYYVYKQVYDEHGKPVEGLYADLDGDGTITAKDRYRYKSPQPKLYFGFNTQLGYKRWSLSMLWRGSLGNYMYNNFNSNNGAYKAFQFPNYLSNVASNVQETNFNNFQLRSDYYVENASFIRMENINIGYDFGTIIRNKANLKLSFNIQNVFLITKYSGLDPEIPSGIDNNFYPRPRVYSFGLSVGF